MANERYHHNPDPEDDELRERIDDDTRGGFNAYRIPDTPLPAAYFDPELTGAGTEQGTDESEEPEDLIVSGDRVLRVIGEARRKLYGQGPLNEADLATSKRGLERARAELAASAERAKAAEESKNPPRRVPPKNWKVAK